MKACCAWRGRLVGPLGARARLLCGVTGRERGGLRQLSSGAWRRSSCGVDACRSRQLTPTGSLVFGLFTWPFPAGAAIALHAAGLPAEALALLQREGWEGLLAARARERVARRRGVLRLLGKGSGAELGGAGSGETAVLEADAEEADADGKEKAAEELAQLEPAAIVAPPRLLNRVSTSLGLQPVLKPTLSVRGAVVADDGLLLAAPAPPAKAWEDP